MVETQLEKLNSAEEWYKYMIFISKDKTVIGIGTTEENAKRDAINKLTDKEKAKIKWFK